MSVPGGDLAPTPIVGGAFGVRPARLPAAAASYIRIARRLDSAAAVFGAAVARWRARTPRSSVLRQSHTFAAVLSANIRNFRRRRWPAAVRGLVRDLIVHLSALLALVEAAPSRVPRDFFAWNAAYAHNGLSVTRTARLIRRNLHGPTFG
jgi:hypothetical protein